VQFPLLPFAVLLTASIFQSCARLRISELFMAFSGRPSGPAPSASILALTRSSRASGPGPARHCAP